MTASHSRARARTSRRLKMGFYSRARQKNGRWKFCPLPGHHKKRIEKIRWRNLFSWLAVNNSFKKACEPVPHFFLSNAKPALFCKKIKKYNLPQHSFRINLRVYAPTSNSFANPGVRVDVLLNNIPQFKKKLAIFIKKFPRYPLNAKSLPYAAYGWLVRRLQKIDKLPFRGVGQLMRPHHKWRPLGSGQHRLNFAIHPDAIFINKGEAPIGEIIAVERNKGSVLELAAASAVLNSWL